MPANEDPIPALNPLESVTLEPATPASSPEPKPRRSLFAILHPSSSQNAFSATLLLMLSTLLSGVLGLVRTYYINRIFGASPETDAYNAAFQLPDMLAYFLVGGVVSISLVTILSRYRAQNDEAGADRALSIILNAMAAVLLLGIVIAEIFAPYYTHIAFRGFDPHRAALCTALTRLLLPAQFFFFLGGVLGSRLLVRKIFLYQAISPLIYNSGIILGAIFLHQRFGIYSLAIGVLVGVILGPAALNLYGAFHGGLRYHAILNLRHPAFLEWLRLTLPLMIGVSLVTADKWILSYFASNDVGGISLLTVAKTLFTAPMGILGQAAGAASLPFFSALFSQNRLDDFANAVNRSVSRVLAASFLLGAWMIALAKPIVDLFRGGSFTPEDARATAVYFTLFTLSIAFWSAQGIYARSFYAAGNTVTPATAGWIVTLVSIPIYAFLFHTLGLKGLTIASDIGIVIQTLTLAILLNRRKLVRLSGLELRELGGALLAAIISFAGAASIVHLIPLHHSHLRDLLIIATASAVWAALAVITLHLTGSRLLNQIRSRLV
ncbi:murein biosynthesis integral membrane protein MurJ [Tunturibacter empetritectus]|uniref:Peptidoglycan lipid II flippase n=1 Tax=Tunturiibacter empetritectus TaxID=3069691 RepID=A0A7W8MRY9_9BACT|nr:murein biosynthesis integral membrane protein MurJ [Edaphobacter lichenicola]MBB5317335.1 putative peptidoglycan lipid II flippase [Edaphobacter lichenicola]